MKKHLKSKSYSTPPRLEPDMAGLIIKMQQQLNFLEKKIDTLIGQASARPVEERHHPRQFRRFDQPYRQGEVKQGNGYRERTLHKAICADCNKECEVPFRPSGDRPVYCKECFGKRKVGRPFREKRDDRPVEVKLVHARSVDKYQAGEMRKFGEKKNRASKKRKKRS